VNSIPLPSAIVARTRAKTGVPAPDDVEHFLMAAFAFLAAGTDPGQRLDYARRCIGLSIAELAAAVGEDVRLMRRRLKGQKLPGEGAGTWVRLAKAAGVTPEWLEHGNGRIGGRYIAPPWLFDAWTVIGKIHGNAPLHPRHESFRAIAQEAIARAMDVPVLVPIRLEDLKAVVSALPPGQRLRMAQVLASGGMRLDELARLRPKKARS
jgi:hypothetical protein